MQVIARLTSPDAQIFQTQDFRNAVIDLDLDGIAVIEAAGTGGEHTSFRPPMASIEQWDGFAGPVTLGLALRQAMGEPVYAQMGVKAHEW